MKKMNCGGSIILDIAEGIEQSKSSGHWGKA